MKFLLDNCLSYKFAAMLRALGVNAMAVRDEFSEDISDIDLFGKLKGQRIVFITTDARQRTRKAEAVALRQSGIRTIFIGPFWSKMGFWRQAAWLVNKWPVIEGFATPLAKGNCAEISQGGTIQPFAL